MTPSRPNSLATSSFLFDEQVMEAITAEEAKGIYTASRCPEHKREAIIQLLGEGRSKRSIEKLLGVHRLTINAVEEKHFEEVDAVRVRTSKRMRRAVSSQLDRIEDDPGIIPANMIPSTIGILTDKAELLDGRATVRVEHVETIDIYSGFTFDEFVKQLPAADVKEIGPGTHLGAEKKLAIGSEALGAVEGGTDGRSDEQGEAAQAKSEGDTALDTDRGPAGPGGEGPPGGGSDPAGSADCSTGNGQQKILGNRSADR